MAYVCPGCASSGEKCPRRQRPIDGEEPCETWAELTFEEDIEDALSTKLTEAAEK
ncbi:hypothetical protein QBC45DRAFT_396533 [Copromyces sp. CBS 386.78]|nr:hypothetical protein QBC45DRAFT_396533 [Copromyces sp. CBS 386.78]